MNSNDKIQVYRQMYHAANGLENRFARPSSSSLIGFDRSGPSPLLNAKVMGVAVGIGVSLAAVFAAFRSTGREVPTREEQSEEQSEAEELEEIDESLGSVEEEDPDLDTALEVVDPDKPYDDSEGSPGLWDSILEKFGFGPDDPGLIDEASSSETTRLDPPDSRSSAGGITEDSKPHTLSRKSKGKDASEATSKSPTKGKTDKGTIAISRGHTLSPDAKADRTSQSGNSAFSGKYKRLARANLSSSELMWATRLIKMGVPIAGRMGRSMLPVVKSVIVAHAKKHGLDPTEMLKVASMESGGDPNAVSSTGAIGVFQFTSATAKAFGLNNRFDLDANVEAGMLLANENLRSLPTKDALSMYIAHQIGVSSAKEVLSSKGTRAISDLRKKTQRSIKVNVGGKSSTINEYLAANQKKLDSSYNQQLSAAPFKGEIKIHLASGDNAVSNKTAVSSISVPEKVSFANENVSTTVVPEQLSAPDRTYHAKVDLDPPREQPTEEQPSDQVRNPALPNQEGNQKFQSAFVTNNGALVVM